MVTTHPPIHGAKNGSGDMFNLIVHCILVMRLFIPAEGNAVETYRGVVRESTGEFCSLGCSQFYLEPDPTYQRTSLQGNFSSFIGQHVQVTGYRDLCSGCFVLILTESVVTLPPLVSVEDGNDALPLEVRLFQNYPNPFNPKTQIQFTIDKSQIVTIKVYDVLGNEIVTILHRELPRGVHKMEWDGSNSPSGLYFYKLQAEARLYTGKMLLLR